MTVTPTDATPPAPPVRPRRVFDCLLYNGELEALLIRLNELADVVDAVVIVEATRTFSGRPKPLALRAQWEHVRPFAGKLRYVVVADDVEAGDVADPWAREAFQRNCVTRGLTDAEASDLVLISDVDEIPRARTVRAIREGDEGAHGLVLRLSYFALNYVHTAGPEVDMAVGIALPYGMLAQATPETLRHAIRGGTEPATILRDAGWHFSYLSDLAGIRKKIGDFSHQEYNTPEFLSAIDPMGLIAARRDLFGREAYQWDILGEEGLPDFVRANRDRFAHRILTPDAVFAAPAPPPAAPESPRPPVILCPYVREADRDRVVSAFGLEDERGQRLPFHLWQDRELKGPERAYEEGWRRFPDQDVIIVHTDMAPMPEDPGNTWYERLLGHVAALPDGCIIGCDLLFPLKSPSGRWYAQCAGGRFEGGGISHFGGHVDLRAGAAGPEACLYDDRFAGVRRADWVTFAGAYLRRDLLDSVGSFDSGYRWAYVMDADYALEARVRGANLYQVPVTLLHEENGSTRPFLDDPAFAEKVAYNYSYFQAKWGAYLARLAASAREESAPTPWPERHAAILLAEAHARGEAFAVAAYARALSPDHPAAVTLTEVERAYRQILDRAIDPGAREAWVGLIHARAVSADELVTGLVASDEHRALVARSAPSRD